MKKLFSSLLAVTFALSSMAAETAYVRMKLAGSNPTYSTSTIKLTENSDRTPAYESGYDSERMMEQSNDNSVLFYAYVGTQECANIATNNLDGLVLCFNTNNIDQNYTISFELVSGRDLTLYDRVTKTSTPIVQGESYPFSVTAAQVGRVAVTDRFVINYVAPDWVYMEGDFDNPDGGGAWIATSGFTYNGTSYSIDMVMEANAWYHFQLKEHYGENDYIAADGSPFDRDNNSDYIPVTGYSAALLLHTDAAGTYTFTWNDLTDNLTITFPDVVEVTTNAYGLATFSYASDLKAVEDVKLYKGAISGEYLDLDDIDYVKAGEGVIVYGAASTKYHFYAGTGTSDFSGNELKAASAWAYPHAGYNAYVLSGNSLYLYEGDAFPANKAFLLLSTGAGAPKRISFRFNQPTAVENAKATDVKAQKFVENGQILIKRGEDVYNLQGQIVK